MMNSIKTTSLILIMSLILVVCKKKVQPKLSEVNKECDCAQEVSADFTMEEMTTSNVNFAQYTVSDTIFGGKTARFSALLKDAEYKWILGSETESTQVTSRLFFQNMVGQNFPITLIVKKKPNRICFPDDDGIDTLTKQIYIRPNVIAIDDTPNIYSNILEGQYKMKSDLLEDSIIITMDFLVVYGSYRMVFNNWNGSGDNDTLWTSSLAGNYFQCFFESRICSPYVISCNIPNVPNGNIHLFPTRRAEMTFNQQPFYQLPAGLNPKIDWKFKGRKL